MELVGSIKSVDLFRVVHAPLAAVEDLLCELADGSPDVLKHRQALLLCVGESDLVTQFLYES